MANKHQGNNSVLKLCCSSNRAITLIQKVIAEIIGTYFLVFAGCGAVAVNKIYGSITFPGICITWGLIVTVMCYSVGHISGGLFNPAVAITWAIFRRITILEAPLYIAAELLGSTLASVTLSLMFDITPKSYFGTVPVGSDGQSLVVEIIISFLLMFVISAVTTDDRAVDDSASVAVGMTIMLNLFIAGPVSGASMNPARSIGPAIVIHIYKGLWIYIVGPIVGAIAGALAYNFLRSVYKPPSEVSADKSPSELTTDKQSSEITPEQPLRSIVVD
ncbi:aquaporin MIP family NIP subfamily [Trifolium pratense]|uniref:Aquaporin MIP family NIP subfamily n=1 Tax=Trifolium pratense TaxID=57577 RepID=A0A2K3L4R9_TRIPR|nr:aquaporin MIP family NIP subfamily [Trifolium pratense]